jgi:hypothetical protein
MEIEDKDAVLDLSFVKYDGCVRADVVVTAEVLRVDNTAAASIAVLFRERERVRRRSRLGPDAYDRMSSVKEQDSLRRRTELFERPAVQEKGSLRRKRNVQIFGQWSGVFPLIFFKIKLHGS